MFVQTNDPTGNQIVSYVHSGRGGLRQVGRVATGGLGVALGGAAVDDLASQGGLTYDAADQLLVGVNGGSNTITEFHTSGPFLGFRRVVASGGTIPVSVAVRGDLIYVLNAGGTGEVQGFNATPAARPGQCPVAGAHARCHAAVPQHPGPDRLHVPTAGRWS